MVVVAQVNATDAEILCKQMKLTIDPGPPDISDDLSHAMDAGFLFRTSAGTWAQPRTSLQRRTVATRRPRPS